MATEGLKKTLVLGHRNPDTDSICSAICYADFKHKLTGEIYEPCRAGNVNPETQYVLDYFKLEAPRLVENVKTQVKDIEIRKTKGVSRGISLKNAWGLMQENNVVTIPCVTEEGLLEGVITIGDITKSYMNLYDSSIISKACTKYANILDTLEGSMVVGDSEAYFDRGKVLIAAANPDLMENYIEKYDGDELYGDLPADVFRHRYVIHVTDPDRIMETKTAVEQVTGIAKARADQAVAEGFTTARNVASIISIALIAILLLVSVFIISNTIKLTTFDRRDEIAIMKMVGATNGFIRWPFVFEGLLLGLFSAVIAFGLQWLLYTAVARGIGTSDSLQILTVIPFEQIWQPVALVFLGAGILVGVGGSLTAIRRFLRV